VPDGVGIGVGGGVDVGMFGVLVGMLVLVLCSLSDSFVLVLALRRRTGWCQRWRLCWCRPFFVVLDVGAGMFIIFVGRRVVLVV